MPVIYVVNPCVRVNMGNRLVLLKYIIVLYNVKANEMFVLYIFCFVHQFIIQ